MSSAANGGYIPLKHPHLLFITVMIATVTVALDASIANVALPHMQGSLSATQDQISWVLTSYILATAIFIPPTAYLAARLGRQRLMAISIGGFLIASMLCGTATSLGEMVVYRFLQGAFGAVLMPLSQTLLMDHYPAEKQGQMLALWGVGAMLGPIIGPSLGGYLTESLSWRWVFYINVPISSLALLGVWKSVPQGEVKRDTPFDLLGFTLLVVSIAALQLLLDRGQSLSWFESTEIIVEATVAGLGFYLFLVHIFTTPEPFVEPRLFRDRNLVAGLVIISMTTMVMMSTLALLPTFMQQLMLIPADTTGMLMIPRGLGSILGMLLISRLIVRVASTGLMVFGLVVLAAAIYEMSKFNLYVSHFTIARTGFMQGFGMAFLSAPLTSIAFATLQPSLRAEGASIFNLMRNVGSSVGISVLFTKVARMTQEQHAHLGEYITPFSNQVLPQAWDWNTTAGAMVLNGEVTRQAASVAYLNSFLLMAAMPLLAIPLCFLFRKSAQS